MVHRDLRGPDGCSPELLHLVHHPRCIVPAVAEVLVGEHLGSYPIVTFQYSSTTLYQVYYHIQ